MPNKVEQHIHCSVDNCHYWAQGNMCHANEILVTSDKMADSYPDRFDAPQAAQLAPTPVSTCMDSCCKTFVSRDSNKVRVDGVIDQ